ncbi:MAG: hypothetical protein WD768_05695 [Phycisphaeraceae bacterium]
MIVVSDTTPLNYLVLIGAIDVLPRLFNEVYVPPAVLRELSHANAPAIVRDWVTSPPAWLKVETPVARLPSTAGLDAGEADAISLAKERHITDVLIDEYRGRKVAAEEGLFALPTLAILERAAEQGLIDLHAALGALAATTYRVRPELIEAALRREAERKRSRD